MTAKEKAKELVEKFEILLSPDIDNYRCTECKEAALIAVDEIMDVLDKEGYEDEDYKIKFYTEVKQEIQNL